MWRKCQLSIFVALICVEAIYGQEIEAWTYTKKMDPNGKYNLTTTVNLVTKEISFEAKVSTPGWMGLGISSNPNMKDADIFIAWYKEGTPVPTTGSDDYYAPANGAPIKDATNDWRNVGIAMNGDEMTVKFQRSFSVTNKTEDKDILDANMHLLWAIGALDATGNPSKHNSSSRGSVAINLLKAPGYTSSAPLQSISFSFVTFILALWMVTKVNEV